MMVLTAAAGATLRRRSRWKFSTRSGRAAVAAALANPCGSVCAARQVVSRNPHLSSSTLRTLVRLLVVECPRLLPWELCERLAEVRMDNAEAISNAFQKSLRGRMLDEARGRRRAAAPCPRSLPLLPSTPTLPGS